MTCSKSFLAFAFVATISLVASAPAYAQRGGGHGGGGGHAVASGGHAVAGGAVVRGGGVYGGAVYGGHAVVSGRYGGYYYPGHYTVVGYAPYHPYYYYRPGVSIGFYAGFGWGYPYYGYGYPYYGYPYYSYPYPAYYNPYPYYSYPAYSYPATQPAPQQAYPDQQSYPPPQQNTMTAQPGGAQAYGGVQIKNAPHDGQVYVDGRYAGIVDDFDGDNKHLNLTAGMHQVEIRVNGQQPMSFDVNVPPNQTITVHVQ